MMYGDCQLVSTMGGGGNVVNSPTLFSSPILNPNFNFMPFQNFSSLIPPKEEEAAGIPMRGKEEMLDSGSGSEHAEEKYSEHENEQQQQQQQQENPNNKKKRYHRHTAHQIQELENLIKQCPHPDDKQRQKLSLDLGLTPRQVKFWFQNRRTQMKAQQDRAENVMLRAENDNFKNENYRLQAALRSLVCPNCGGATIIGEIAVEEHQLRLENARLRDELERVCCLSGYPGSRQLQTIRQEAPLMASSNLDLDMNIYSRHFTDSIITSCTDQHMVPINILPEPSHFPEGGLLLDDEKSLAMKLAVSSLEELVKICTANEPLWMKSGENDGMEMLNGEEWSRLFPWPSNFKQSSSSDLRTEASRDTGVVIMNSINLVDAFLDANKWMELFPSVVTKAKTVQIMWADPSGQANGSLQLMYAELQVVTPLVPTRETHFLRYCQHNETEGSWAIVDFPIDSFHGSFQPSFPRYKRWPSGCLIQDMPNGYSRVTWVEHAEVEEKPVHQIFSQYVYSGLAFGAHRWLSVLQRQCERVASLMARNISDLGVIPSPEARRNLMRLAQRMIRTFSVNMSTSGGQAWTALSDSPEDTIRITTRKVTEPGQPNGVILTAVSTTWLPYSHFHVFEFLRDERRRDQLDVFSNGSSSQEVAHIANGSHPGNCISVLRLNVSRNIELMLQESCTDQSGSLVMYATMDVNDIQMAMSGEDPSCIPLLPLGFSIVPIDSPNMNTTTTTTSHSDKESRNQGCLMTVGLQVVASPNPSAKLNLSTVTAINNYLCNSVQQIISALDNGSNVGCSEPNASSK